MELHFFLGHHGVMLKQVLNLRSWFINFCAKLRPSLAGKNTISSNYVFHSNTEGCAETDLTDLHTPRPSGVTGGSGPQEGRVATQACCTHCSRCRLSALHDLKARGTAPGTRGLVQDSQGCTSLNPRLVCMTMRHPCQYYP